MESENLSWKILVDIQICLIKSRETNVESAKKISQLLSIKEALQLQQAKLQSPVKMWTVYLQQEDADVTRLKLKKSEMLSKQQELKIDLKAVKELARKIKIDAERYNKSINQVEAQCDFTRVSIAAVSFETKRDLETIESIRKKVADQNLIINQLSQSIYFERDVGQRIEKKVDELRSLQEKLEQDQKIQEANILQLRNNIIANKQQAKRNQQTRKQQLKELRVRFQEIKSLNVRITKIQNSLRYS